MRDLDVRTALRRELTQQHDGDDRTLIVEEMGIWSGSVRVDIAVVNGELHGFEIKSARDTLARLPAQQKLYSQVFDRVTLVVAERHAEKAEQLIPLWWGTMLASANAGCTIILRGGRAGGVNPNPDAIQTVRLLWRQELIAILERHSLIKGCRSASRDKLGRTLVSELPNEILRSEIRETLKKRVWSRKTTDNKCKVPICVDFDPLSSPAGARGWVRSDTDDALIGPAPWQPAKI